MDLREPIKGVLRDHLELPAEALERNVFPNSLPAKPLLGLVQT
jgi:uncharacterized protein (DUF1501 family)